MTDSKENSARREAKKLNVLLLAFRSFFLHDRWGGEDSKFNLPLPILKAYAEESDEIRSACEIEYQVHPLDAEEELLMETIYRLNPDVIGFSVFVWNLEKSVQTARKVKYVRPDVKVIFGGPEVDDAQYLLERYSCIDFIALGEGEQTFREFLLWFLEGKPPVEEIRGLAYRREGEIVLNPPRQDIQDLSIVPSVFSPDHISGNSVVYYETARGCRCGCRYCREGVPRKRYYPLDRVEKDMSIILAQPGIKVLNFIDTVLDDDAERAKEIFRIVARHNRDGIACGGYFYFMNADDEFFDLMLKANFRFARTGVESTDPTVLKEVGRTPSNVSNINAALPCRRQIQLTPYIILFLPKDTPETFRQTVKDCYDLGYFFLDFHCTRLRIYPGTDLYRHADKYGYVFDREPPHFVYSTNTFSYADFIRARHLVANLMILCRIFCEEDASVLNSFGFDLFQAAQEIHKTLPEWTQCYRHTSEDVITEIDFNEAAYTLLGNYAAMVVKDKKAVQEIQSMIAKRQNSRQV